MAVNLSVWDDGFTEQITGNVHYVDPLTKQLCVEVKPGEFERLAFDKIVGVTVVD
ncbi:YolD-like family protein [Neobacillus vireti]|uniref:YolD-like family protein n=1 Tax=Neobacillus vireti TaxID=220686 RepID=UPI0004285F2C|nr:YolD-like family protein [Neobacillus vireti]